MPCSPACPSLPAGPQLAPARTDEVRDSGQLPKVLQELVEGVTVIRSDPVLVLQQQLQHGGRKEMQGLSQAFLPGSARHPLWASKALPTRPAPPRLQPLTLWVLTSSPTVMYTMGLDTATMSEYSSIAKRSSGSGTWQVRPMNLLLHREGM